MRTRTGLFAVSVCLFIILAAISGSVHAKSFSSPIRAAHSGLCLDVPESSNEVVGIVQWPCTGNPNQLFDFKPQSDNSYLIQARHSGMCLDVEAGSTENGARLIQYPCHGSVNQRFRVIRSADIFSSSPGWRNGASMFPVHPAHLAPLWYSGAVTAQRINEWHCPD